MMITRLVYSNRLEPSVATVLRKETITTENAKQGRDRRSHGFIESGRIA